MSKLQPVKFRNVEDLLLSLPLHELEIVNALKGMIFSTLPQVTEKLSYNVPFFYATSRICYIWPGSVPWGKTKTGVEFGFVNGYLLNDPASYLEKGNRKQVYLKTFYHVREIDFFILKTFLFEAAEIDRLKNS